MTILLGTRRFASCVLPCRLLNMPRPIFGAAFQPCAPSVLGRGSGAPLPLRCISTNTFTWSTGSEALAQRWTLLGPIVGIQRRTISTTMQDVPLDELLQASEVIKIRRELAVLRQQKLPLTEFTAICGKHGLQEAAAFKLLEAFHKSGVVFHFGTSSSAQLKDTVFIKPQDVLDTVWATLDVSGATNIAALNNKIQELNRLDNEFKALKTVKHVLDVAADKEASRNIWIGGSLPVGCLVILFRMTYWEFSWDIVEPISFFVSTMMPIAFFYVWFAANKQDFTLVGWRQQMVEKAQINLYRARGFDIDRYNAVAQAIDECKEDIRVLEAQ